MAVVIWVIVTTEQPDQTKERAVSAARFLQKGGHEKTRCTNKNTRLLAVQSFSSKSGRCLTELKYLVSNPDNHC